MTFSGDEIIACPNCNHIYKYPIITSYNTFKIEQFSDGHVEGTYPNFISIIKCHNNTCGMFFQLKEAKILGKILKYDVMDLHPLEWRNAHPLNRYSITEKDLKEALTTKFCVNSENQMLVRTLLLRHYNDVFRKDRNHEFTSNRKIAYRDNLTKLIDLYKKELASTEEKIQLAELYRENGDFKSCTELLEQVTPEDKEEKEFKEKIYSQAKVNDDKVFSISRATIKKEYQCGSCNHSVIVFDLAKFESNLLYKHYRCANDNTIFSAPSRNSIPERNYAFTVWKRLFKYAAPDLRFIKNKDISCPKCMSNAIEQFNPEAQNCVNCKTGKYRTVNWF